MMEDVDISRGPANAQRVIEVDYTLLERVRSVLTEAGFEVSPSTLQELQLPWLLAENGLFALGVVAGQTLQDLIDLESEAMFALVDRMQNAGPKRWDLYLVMLARRDHEARGSKEIRRLQYDTTHIRRVVNVGVEPSVAKVRRALSPFLPLPAPNQDLIGSMREDLFTELEARGVAREQTLLIMQSISGPDPATW